MADDHAAELRAQRLLRRQDGVASRQQLLVAGWTSDQIRHRLRSGRWWSPHPGVIVTHRGAVTWLMRAWVGLLACGPEAFLRLEAAAYLERLQSAPPRVIEIGVPHHISTPPRIDGIHVTRTRRSHDVGGHPPHVLMVATSVDLAAAASTADERISRLAAPIGLGVPQGYLLVEVQQRERLAHRREILELLGAVGRGEHSALERRYARDVERAHGLPPGVRQVPQVLDGLGLRADVVYRSFRTRSELDGNLAHPGGRTDLDTWRDNVVLIHAAELTLRYRWRHVAVTPCLVALQVGESLRRGGWTGRVQPCSPGCPAAVDGERRSA